MARNFWHGTWRIWLALVAVVGFACGGKSLEESVPDGSTDGDSHSGVGSLNAAAQAALEEGRSTVPEPPVGWRTVFQDGFDLNQLDSSAWTIENRAATNMGEISFYARDEVSTRDGNLVLRAQKRSMGGRQFTTAQVSTRFGFKYGRVDIRAKMPQSQGFWPALWMLPTAGAAQGFLPEIDIHESISNHGGFYANFHWKDGTHKKQSGPEHIPLDATEWHTYSVEWTSDRIDWLVDDRVVKTAIDGVHTTAHSNMYLLITFALGGSWPGPPDGSTVFPSEMLIDWVRIAQR